MGEIRRMCDYSRRRYSPPESPCVVIILPCVHIERAIERDLMDRYEGAKKLYGLGATQVIIDDPFAPEQLTCL